MMKVKTVADKLLDQAIRHSVFLNQYSNQEVRQIVAFLNTQVEKDLITQLQKYSGDEDLKARVEKLRKAVDKLIWDGYTELKVRLTKDLTQLGKQEAKYYTSMLGQTVPVELDFITPSVGMIREMLINKPINGELIADWFDNVPQQAARRINQAIMLGVTEGESTDTITRRIIGTKANYYSDGIMEANRRDVQALVRTAVNGVSNNTRQTTYEENADVIQGVQIVATLDADTCLRCGELDGQVFGINEGPRPAFHWNCRCTTIPVLKSWAQLGIRAKEIPEGERASMNGQVASKTTFREWLKDQGEGVQREVLGVRRAELFRAGKFKLREFLDDQRNVLTLDQLDAKLRRK